MKKYILYAGVNGAGKSTLYQTTHYKDVMYRINTDEILKSFGDWRNAADVMQAGRIAVQKLKQYLRDGETFNQETTLCGKSIIKTVHQVKSLGYMIEMHYVGLESIELAKQRISKRVASGGHGIPDKDVERRYEESLLNLKEVIPLCDLAALYDNTESFRRFAIFKGGKLIRLSNKAPKWFYDRYKNMCNDWLEV